MPRAAAGSTIGFVDLVIREADGWEELDEFQEALNEPGGPGIREIWDASAVGDLGAVAEALDDLGFELGGKLAGFRFIIEPDDILYEHYRAWVKYA